MGTNDPTDTFPGTFGVYGMGGTDGIHPGSMSRSMDQPFIGVQGVV